MPLVGCQIKQRKKEMKKKIAATEIKNSLGITIYRNTNDHEDFKDVYKEKSVEIENSPIHKETIVSEFSAEPEWEVVSKGHNRIVLHLAEKDK